MAKFEKKNKEAEKNTQPPVTSDVASESTETKKEETTAVEETVEETPVETTEKAKSVIIDPFKDQSEIVDISGKDVNILKGFDIKSEKSAMSHFKKNYKLPEGTDTAYVTEDGNVFYEANAGSAFAHSRERGLKMFTIKP